MSDQSAAGTNGAQTDPKAEQRKADRAAQVETNKVEQNAAKTGVDLSLLSGKVVEFEPKSATEMWLLAQYFFAARNALPQKLGGVGDVFMTLMAGRSLGLDAVTALRGIEVIDGNVFIGADLMRAILNTHLKREDGEWVDLKESTDKIATYEWKRKGWTEPKLGSFTEAEAIAAGLLPAKPKSAWGTYKKAMMRHRSLSIWAREYFPERFQRVYSTDERDEMSEVNARPDKGIIPATTAPTQVDAKPEAKPAAETKFAELAAPAQKVRLEDPREAEPMAVSEGQATAAAEKSAPAAAAGETATEEDRVLDLVGKAEAPEAFAAALGHIQNLPKADQVDSRLALIRQIDLHLAKPGAQPTADLGKLLFRVVSGLPEDQRELGQKVYVRHKWPRNGA